MREYALHQAAGLVGLIGQQLPRLTALVSHGDAQSELPLLWKLCSSMVDLGYSVTVLDGTTKETADNPGLEQILDCTYWRESRGDAPQWSVVPSLLGLISLSNFARPAAHSLSTLAHTFTQDGILLMYSNARLLSTLLSYSGVRPLLPISTSKTSLLTSYMALKRLLHSGGIQPTVINVVHSANRTTTRESTIADNLTDCAKYFLNYDMNISTIVLTLAEDPPGMDMQRAALAMVENAIPLDAGWSTPMMQTRHETGLQVIRSH